MDVMVSSTAAGAKAATAGPTREMGAVSLGEGAAGLGMKVRDIVLLAFWFTIVVAGDLYLGGSIAFLLGW